jgi:hypothetical protein
VSDCDMFDNSAVRISVTYPDLSLSLHSFLSTCIYRFSLEYVFCHHLPPSLPFLVCVSQNDKGGAINVNYADVSILDSNFSSNAAVAVKSCQCYHFTHNTVQSDIYLCMHINAHFFSRKLSLLPKLTQTYIHIYLRLRCLAEHCTCSLLIRLSTDVSCTTTLQVMMEERCTPLTAPPPSCTPSLNPTVRYDNMIQHTNPIMLLFLS